jgi:hypothetical protein
MVRGRDALINVERGRELLRCLLGDIRIAPRGDYFVARMRLGIAQPILASNRGSGGAIFSELSALSRELKVA